MAGSIKPAKKQTGRPEVPSSDELALFYQSPNGQRLDKEIASHLEGFLEDVNMPKRHVLCVGHPGPKGVPIFEQGKSFSVLTPGFQGQNKIVTGGLNRTTLGDEAHLPFMEASFDIAMICHAIEYMEDPMSFFEELWKVLSPGGKIILMVPNRAGGWKKAGIPHACNDQGFNFRVARDFLFEKGFECVDCKGVFHGLKFAKGKRPILEGVMRSVARHGPGIMPGFFLIKAEKIIGAKGKQVEQAGQLRPTTPIPT